MTKFTKGEWNISCRPTTIFSDETFIIETGYDADNPEQGIYDAHLIAAAPAMYNALLAMSKGEGLQPGTTIEGILLKARGESL